MPCSMQLDKERNATSWMQATKRASGGVHCLVGNFDLKSLFSLSVGGFYSDDCVLWLGTEEMIGKTAAFQRMASVLEPIYTLFEMGMAFVESFRATANYSVGNFITDWEAVLGRTQLTSITFRWRTVRAWKDRVVIAERIESLPS